MSYKEVNIFSSKDNYYSGSTRPDSAIKFIVIHYTANKGDTAKANGRYFQSPNRHASAHMFVDDDYVVHSVQRNYSAWSVGGSKYPDCGRTGGGKLYGKCTNRNSLSIELCGTGDGYRPSQKTIDNAIHLTKCYMKKLNIDKDHVIRHFDVTGKYCPVYWMDNKKWEKEFHGKLTDKPLKKKSAKSKHSYYKSEGFYKVMKIPRVIRNSYSSKAKIVGSINNHDVYTITGVKSTNGVYYGKLKSGKGWICLRTDYVKKI